MTEVMPHWLTKQANLSPNQVAIELENGATLTFSALQKESQRMARKLATLNISKGSHVGILSTNSISMVTTIHALSYLGAVAVLLNTRLTAEEINYQINDAEVSLVIACEHNKEQLKRMDSAVPVESFSNIDKYEEKQVNLCSEIHVEDIFTIIYTSGTTGFPKGVVHTYGNHWSSAISSMLNLGLDKNDKWLACLPIFHVGGLSVFLRSVIYGIPVLLLERFDEKVVNQAIINKGVTIVSVVTVMLQRLIKSLDENKYPTSFRCMLLGGGPAPKPILQQAKNHQIPVFQTYGLTETSSQIVTLSPSDALTKIGSAGKPLFTAQLKINEQNQDGIGEIYVKGPMVTKGYFQNEQATTVSFERGWLATGDLGYVDEEGFLYVVDRRTDLIISGGENIYPAEIEAALLSMKEISEVGVVGVKHDIWGQVPVAFIVKNKQTVTKQAILNHAKQILADYKVPKHIYFIDNLPRNASNKLVRKKLLTFL